jgi:hypothetical protein
MAESSKEGCPAKSLSPKEYRFSLFDFRGLLAFLLTQIGYHQAQCVALVSPKPVQRQIHRNQTSISAPQAKFAFCNGNRARQI